MNIHRFKFFKKELTKFHVLVSISLSCRSSKIEYQNRPDSRRNGRVKQQITLLRMFDLKIKDCYIYIYIFKFKIF